MDVLCRLIEKFGSTAFTAGLSVVAMALAGILSAISYLVMDADISANSFALIFAVAAAVAVAIPSARHVIRMAAALTKTESRLRKR
jgi:hypothetical protein